MVAAIGVTVDITERKKVEEELQKMEKLKSIGTLAGGIAHDFNNILIVLCLKQGQEEPLLSICLLINHSKR